MLPSYPLLSICIFKFTLIPFISSDLSLYINFSLDISLYLNAQYTPPININAMMYSSEYHGKDIPIHHDPPPPPPTPNPLTVWQKWTPTTNQLTLTEIIQHAFLYIWPNGIDECRLNCFCHA